MSLADVLTTIQTPNSKSDLQQQLEASMHDIEVKAKDSVVVNDAYGNSLMAIGTDDKVETFTNYGFSNDTLNWMLWLALYNDSWVFRRAIDKPAQDEIGCGITLQGNANFEDIYRKLKKYRFDFIQLLQWGGLFGGSIACMMFNNVSDKEYAQPMNYEKLKKSKTMRMYVVDRWYGVAPSSKTVEDMNSLDFGKPEYYDVTMADGKTYRYHHDYVLRYEHRVAPKLVKMGMLQGWGYAEGSHIINELSRDDKLKSSIASLVDKSLIEVIKMSGMRGVFMGADKDNETQLRKRLEMVNWGRSFNSLTFLDKDDDYVQNTYSGLSGLSDLLEKNMWLVSAALEMQGVLYGDLKQGFSNDENALERYDETINNRCENYLRPVYEKFLSVLYNIEGIDEKIEFEFNSLLTKKEDRDSVDNLQAFTDLASKLLEDGVIDVKQYAKAVQTYTTKHKIDFGLTDAVIEKMSNEMQEMIEGFDFEKEQ